MGVLKVNVGDAVTPVWRKIGCGSPPPNGTAFSDDFNRANGALGSPWTITYRKQTGKSLTGGGPAFAVASNVLRCNGTVFLTGGIAAESLAYQDFGSADFDMQWTYNVQSSGGFLGGMFRLAADEKSFYFFKGDGLYWINDGALVYTYDPASDRPVTGDVIRLVAIGGTMSYYRNGTLISSSVSVANNTIATWHGIWGNGVPDTASRIDDYTCDPAAAPIAGRLKLWDGSRWFRERCDSDVSVGRPLKVYDGTTWQTVACMVLSEDDAASGLYDTDTYDFTVYG